MLGYVFKNNERCVNNDGRQLDAFCSYSPLLDNAKPFMFRRCISPLEKAI